MILQLKVHLPHFAHTFNVRFRNVGIYISLWFIATLTREIEVNRHLVLCSSALNACDIAVWIRTQRGGRGRCVGCVIAQAVSLRLPTAAARVRWDLWWTKWHCGACFFRVLRFPLPILIPPNWYNRAISGRRTKWTQSHSTQRNNKKS
jgi:hypothetical protein